ncbi:MAG: histidine phosphatase family protein [Lautropia sp.]
MKTLLLIRHAHAGHGEPGLPDRARTLSTRGQQEALALGRRLADRHLRPTLVVTSPALRTAETARAVARALGYRLEDIVPNERLYECRADELLDTIAAFNDRHSVAIVVGHNPALSELAWRFSEAIEFMAPASVATVEFDTDEWIALLHERPVGASLDAGEPG